MIAAEPDDRGLALVELACLLLDRCVGSDDVNRNRRGISRVDHLHFVERKYVKGLAVGLQKKGGLSDGCRPEPCAATERRAEVDRRTEQRCVCAADVLESREASERAKPHESRNVLCIDLSRGLCALHLSS